MLIKWIKFVAGRALLWYNDNIETICAAYTDGNVYRWEKTYGKEPDTPARNMKKLLALLALMLAVSMLWLTACDDDGKNEDTTEVEETTEEETTEEETTEEETTEEETTEEETTEESTEAETEAVTDANTWSSGWGNGNGEISGGDLSGSGSLGDFSGGSGSGTFGEGFSGNGNSGDNQTPVETPSGKVLVHTYSDRPAASDEDNSTTVPYMPMISDTVFPSPNESYNIPRLFLEDIKPGTVCEHVIIGYDDYMFYEDTVNDFIGSGFLSESVYNRLVQTLRERNNWAESNGKKFYFVIAPNKNTVYPDYMPEGYTMGTYRRYDQFVELLESAGITAVDLRGTMAAAVQEVPERNLYYKYDTHWNNHAGYFAYRATMDMIKEDFPNVVIHDKSEYQINYCETYMKDLAYYLGYYSYLKDYGPVYTLKSGRTATLEYYTPKASWGQFTFAYVWPDGYSDKLYYFQYRNDYNQGAPNAYIMRDSYSIAMVPFLKDSFYRSTYNWTFGFDKNEIINADADVIIVIVAERNLRNYANGETVID